MRILLLGISFFLLLPDVSGQFFYGLRQEFGKNRVQYTGFDWVFYRFERYDVYFYKGNDELAAQVARMTEEQLPAIESILEAPLDERIQILVFNNLSDLKQSNVNSSSEEDYNMGGITRISGRRLFLHFTGDYVKLAEDLRSGLTEVVLSNLVYGSFTESIRNSALLNLPQWYTEGLISYMGNPNNQKVEKYMRDAFMEDEYDNINSAMGEEARYMGHSIWNYLADTYGPKMLKNVIYMAIVNRNIESGFLYILGKDLEAVIEGWGNYLREKYSVGEDAAPLPEKPLIKAPKGYRITFMETSADGRYMAYVQQKFSRYKVYVYDFGNDRRRRILTEGFRIAQNADYSYPLLAWHPNGKVLAMITEKKGFTYLSYYDLEEKKWQEQPFYKFDKILSLEYSRDGKRFVISAVKDGQSDIFIYTILNTKVEQLTDDTYTDLNPAWIQNGRRIAFSSNRISDTLKHGEEAIKFPKKYMDIYAMPAFEPEDTVLIWQMTNSPGIDEIKPQKYAEGYVSFLSRGAGTTSLNLLKIDSTIVAVDTVAHYRYDFSEYKISDYKRSILDYGYMKDRGEKIELAYVDEKYRLYKTPFFSPGELNLEKVIPAKEMPGTEDGPVINTIDIKNNKAHSVPLYYPGVDPSTFEIDIHDYEFEDVSGEQQPTPTRRERRQPTRVKILPTPAFVDSTDTAAEEKPLEIPPKRNYFLSFFKDDFTLGFDNVFDNPQYQRFTGFVSSDLLNSGFNMNLKTGVLELMHDYRITAGLSTAFQPLNGTSIIPNSEIMIAVSDYKNRLDKDYIFSRGSQVFLRSDFDFSRIIINEATAKFSWPFNPVASIRGSLGYRMDQIIQLSRDENSLREPTRYRDYAIARLAYVYDNTRKIGVNLYSGLRYKIFTEYYRNLYTSPTGLHTAGIDLRNYTIIHKNFIWANRFAAGTSFGPEKLIYIMGGTDNSFGPKFEPTTPIATENNYIFQTLVTNMRGFYQNARNGNSFAVINSELRLPVFSYIFKKPIKSDFIKNFQIVGFGDIGTAWNGFSPYAEENAINTRELPFGPQGGHGKIVLNSQKEPIIWSYGVGLRTRLFGYYLRADWAWPVEDGIVLPSEFTISLGFDF